MILIGDCGSSKTPEIRKMLDEFVDCAVVPFLDIDIEKTKGYDGIVLSGAPILLTEEKTDQYIQASTWIKEIKIPILGICFGHQMIALQYGGFVKKMREDRDFQDIEIFEESALFSRLPRIIQMQEDHCEFASVPQNFKLLASSDNCFNEAMQHNELQIYGVQFHPEVSGLQGSLIFENFYKICMQARD